MKTLRIILMLASIMLFAVPLSGEENINDILDKHAAALGGREKYASLKSVIAYASVDYMGTPGTQVMRVELPYRYRVDVNLGIMKQAIGCNGVVSWQTDPNGLTRADSPEERKALFNELFLSSGSYFMPDLMPGRTLLLKDTLVNNKNYYLLGLYPEGGDSTFLLINSETYLADYRIEILTGLRFVTEYKDYFDIDGYVMPKRSEAYSPGTPIVIKSEADSVFFNRDIPVELFDYPGKSGHDYLFAPDVSSVTVEIDDRHDHLFIEARINGKGPFRFLLDSGAGFTILSEKTAEQLEITTGGEMAARGVGGFSSVGFGEVDSLNIGELSLYLSRVAIYDMTQLGGDAIGQMDGIFGYDLFARFPIRIDFRNKKMTIFADGGALDYSGYTIVPFEVFYQLPLIDVSVDGREVRAALDLGAQMGFVLQNGARATDVLRKEYNEPANKVTLQGIGGAKSADAFKMKKLEIGSLTIADPLVIVTDDFAGMPLPDYIEGLIGVETLRQFDLILNYPERKIGLKPLD